MIWERLVFHLSRFLQTGYRLFCLHDLSMSSSSDPGSPYDISQMLRMSSLRILSRRVWPEVMHLKLLISVVASRRLMMVVPAFASMA
jgi:hypothetical protein